jgi:two-component system NarL family response regulator
MGLPGAGPSARRQPVSWTGVSCRIVICDDQPGFRQLLTVVLGLEDGLEVVGEASDGVAVVDVVTRLSPDVLLLDVAMPERDGIEALPEIKSASPGTDVVMLTAFGSESVRKRAFAAGASGFIEKGADVDAIVAQVLEACAS